MSFSAVYNAKFKIGDYQRCPIQPAALHVTAVYDAGYFLLTFKIQCVYKSVSRAMPLVARIHFQTRTSNINALRHWCSKQAEAKT